MDSFKFKLLVGVERFAHKFTNATVGVMKSVAIVSRDVSAVHCASHRARHEGTKQFQPTILCVVFDKKGRSPAKLFCPSALFYPVK